MDFSASARLRPAARGAMPRQISSRRFARDEIWLAEALPFRLFRPSQSAGRGLAAAVFAR